jgi:hypothetical protein
MISLPPGSPIRTGQTKSFHGLTLVIETPQHEMREGKGWMNASPAHYGYISGYIGADGDDIDMYLGPNEDSDTVWVIDQNRMDFSGRFDEHKCMLGYDDEKEALTDFMQGHTDGNRIFSSIRMMPMKKFKQWLENGDLKERIGG